MLFKITTRKVSKIFLTVDESFFLTSINYSTTKK